MHFDLGGIVAFYGELAFGVVCTFWIYEWIEGRVKKKPP